MQIKELTPVVLCSYRIRVPLCHLLGRVLAILITDIGITD